MNKRQRKKYKKKLIANLQNDINKLMSEILLRQALFGECKIIANGDVGARMTLDEGKIIFYNPLLEYLEVPKDFEQVFKDNFFDILA